jgi:hypothetical protein
VAVYEYEFHNPVPDQFASGFIGSIELYAGKGENLDKIEAKISSGNATFNAHFGDSPLPALDIDDFPNEDLIWQIRAEDLGASKSDNDAVDLWYSQPSSSETQSYRQATSTNRPTYYADQDGLGSQSNPNDSPCVYFNGFSQSLDQYGGDAEIPYTDSWTLVTAIGKKNAGSYRGVIGTKSTSSIQSLYGDWGRHRTRQGIFSGSTREYTHSTALLAHDQIRVMTVEYNTDGNYYINEWINGTKTYGPVTFQYGSGPWKFDMLGSVQYVAGSNTYYLRFSGGISEMWLIKGVVDTTTRKTIEGHVAHKYDSSSILPTTHPYYSTDPNSSVTFMNATDLNLTSTYQTLKSSIGQNLAKNGDLISFYMPKVQQPGTVTIKVTVT